MCPTDIYRDIFILLPITSLKFGFINLDMKINKTYVQKTLALYFPMYNLHLS